MIVMEMSRVRERQLQLKMLKSFSTCYRSIQMFPFAVLQLELECDAFERTISRISVINCFYTRFSSANQLVLPPLMLTRHSRTLCCSSCMLARWERLVIWSSVLFHGNFLNNQNRYIWRMEGEILEYGGEGEFGEHSCVTNSNDLGGNILQRSYCTFFWHPMITAEL